MKIRLVSPSEIPNDQFGRVISLDIETEDLAIDSSICMVSLFNPKSDEALVIPIKVYQGGTLKEISEIELEVLKTFLTTIKAVGHNLQFDLAHIKYHWGIDINVYFDTFLFARIMPDIVTGKH